MKGIFASLLIISLCGCGEVNGVLSSLGVNGATVTKVDTAALALGTLGCKSANLIAAVPTVKVNNATSAAVAAACSVISINGVPELGAVPVPLPTGEVAVATVPPPIAAAVAASVPTPKL